MLALIAMIIFLLALFKVHIGSIDLVILGFVFLAAHCAFEWRPWTAWRRQP